MGIDVSFPCFSYGRNYFSIVLYCNCIYLDLHDAIYDCYESNSTGGFGSSYHECCCKGSCNAKGFASNEGNRYYRWMGNWYRNCCYQSNYWIWNWTSFGRN